MSKRLPDTNVTNPVDPFEFPEPTPDYHAIYSIQVCELVNAGFDVFGDTGYADVAWPTDEDRERVEGKLLRKFWFREIDPRVPGIWRYNLTTRLQLLVPKYAPVWTALKDGYNPLAAEDEYEKNRRVYSDFPATALDKETSDYASTSDDFERERVRLANVQDQLRGLTTYNDVDASLLEELEPCFCQLLSVTIAGM